MLYSTQTKPASRLGFTQSLADTYTRPNKLLATTGFSGKAKLPQLSRSFSSGKSTKLKLTTM